MDSTKPHRTWRSGNRRAWVLLCGLSIVAASGCDSLLEVDVPGAVAAGSLGDPQMMPSLASGALGQVECALAHYVDGSAILADEYVSAAFWRNFNVWGAKLLDLRTWGGDCQTTNDASNLGFFIALSKARFMTDDAIRQIEAFEAAQLPFDQNKMLGQLNAYAGYTYIMLGEGFCEMAIDGSPLMTPAEVFEGALERFNRAEQLAGTANDQAIKNLALVGKARALLNLGRKTEAAAAAKQVPQGFVHNAAYSTSTPRRSNRVYLNSHSNKYTAVHEAYRDLMVGDVPDPRVALQYTPGSVGHDNFTALYLQRKYPAATTPIPMATWREAQLIVAEAELGQSAVDRINALRTFHQLPQYTPASVSDDAAILAQVIEERRRELFLEGHRLGDKLRYGIPFPTGLNHKNEAYGPITCMPLPESERLSNPNIAKTP